MLGWINICTNLWQDDIGSDPIKGKEKKKGHSSIIFNPCFVLLGFPIFFTLTSNSSIQCLPSMFVSVTISKNIVGHFLLALYGAWLVNSLHHNSLSWRSTEQVTSELWSSMFPLRYSDIFFSLQILVIDRAESSLLLRMSRQRKNF